MLAVCNEAGVPVTAAAGRSGVCGASVPVHGGVVLDLCGLTGIVDVDADLARARRRARHLRRPPRARAAHRPRPHPRPLAAVGRAVHRRRLARLPLRRPALDPLREDRGHGRSASTSPSPTAARSPPAARPAPRSAPTSTSSSSAPRARSASSPAPGCACTRRPPTSAGPPTASPSFDDGHRRHAPDPPARRAPRPCCASTTRPRPTAPTRPATAPCSSCSTRATSPSSTRTMELVAEACRDAHHEDVEHVAHWLEHRNDVAALEALISPGLRGRHDGGRRPLARPARDLRRHHRRPQRRRGHDLGVRPPVAQLHRRRLPLLHLRRQGRAPTTATATTAPRGTPAAGPCSPPAARCPTTTASGLNRSRFVAEALGPAFDVLAAVKARPRPATASSTPASSGSPPPSAPPGTEARR